ncbi:MAG: Ni/Fe hydrogenase subunit alpha [Flavobacteriales bacterium]|nr:Ni/Fe hydrogenase subunit alpha [Flavobacteriales bacterium]
MFKKITIEPVTRVEGHGKVTILMDEHKQVKQTRLHIVEFRGFEKFIQGRPFWEAPVVVQRLCGICPVSHHLAAAKALDIIVGVDKLTAVGEKMRRLMHYGQIFQSHSLHFFHLSSPDLLFGIDSDPRKRNIFGVVQEHRDLAVKGIMMRKFGQQVIEFTAGKRIHGTGAIPGGINKNLSIEERDILLKNPDLNANMMVDWAQEALEFFKAYHKKNKDFIDNFSKFESSHMSLVRNDGAMDLYHGNLRVIDKDRKIILNDVNYADYTGYIEEEVKSWTFMKFPYLKFLGKEKGWYRVGPLARLNTVDFIPTPLAQKEFEQFRAYNHGKSSSSCLHTHWARLIEILHSAEVIRDLLNDTDLQNSDLMLKGKKRFEGIGVIEAPRGTLFHHYKINKNDQITMANLIVSTTHNNTAMNLSVENVAKSYLTNQKKISEGMLNAIETAIRAYDPCLSCATHAMGQMPLDITMLDSNGNVVDSLIT